MRNFKLFLSLILSLAILNTFNKSSNYQLNSLRRIGFYRKPLLDFEELLELLRPWAEEVKKAKEPGKKAILLFDLTGTLKEIGKGKQISTRTMELLAQASKLVNIGIVSGAGIKRVSNNIIEKLPADFNKENLILYALLAGVSAQFNSSKGVFEWQNIAKLSEEQKTVIEDAVRKFKEKFSSDIVENSPKWELGVNEEKICYTLYLKSDLSEDRLQQDMEFLEAMDELSENGISVKFNRPIRKIFLTSTTKATIRDTLNEDVFPLNLRIGVGDSAFDLDMVGSDSMFVYVGEPDKAPENSIVLSKSGPFGSDILLQAIIKLLGSGGD